MDSARLIWSLASSGIGTGIAGPGNSGSWSSSPADAETLVDLRWTDDIVIMAAAGTIVSAPTLSVFLDTYDDQGNVYPQVGAGPVITATGGRQVALGSHAPTAAQYLVLPQWGRISWTCTGGSVTGAQIAVYGR